MRVKTSWIFIVTISLCALGSSLQAQSQAQMQVKAAETRLESATSSTVTLGNNIDVASPQWKWTKQVDLRGRQTIYPPLRGGDREYSGNGPIMKFRTRVYCSDGKNVYRQVYASAIESKITIIFLTDKTTYARGWSQPELIYTAPDGWIVENFRRTDHRFPRHVDTNHNPQRFNTRAGSLTYYGDTDGDDVGRYTRATLIWNSSVQIEMFKRAIVLE